LFNNKMSLFPKKAIFVTGDSKWTPFDSFFNSVLFP
jgi:hypothetical protein